MTDQPTITSDLIEEELTWDELSKPQVKELVLPDYGGKKIKYLSSLPLNRILELSAKHAGDLKAGDRSGYVMDLLMLVMVSPEVRTIGMARTALNANGSILMRIITDVEGIYSKDKVAAGDGPKG